MCLATNELANDKFKADHTGKIECYKVLVRSRYGIKPVLLSPIHEYKWVTGENKSDKTPKLVSIPHQSYVNFLDHSNVFEGIHVFLNKEAAMVFATSFGQPEIVIVKVECDMKDFVACGYSYRWIPTHETVDGAAPGAQAVFSKVTLTQEEHEKGLNHVHVYN